MAHLISGATCQLSDLEVEQLFFIVTNMSPKISVKDLDVVKKRESCSLVMVIVLAWGLKASFGFQVKCSFMGALLQGTDDGRHCRAPLQDQQAQAGRHQGD